MLSRMKRKQAAYSEVITEALGTKQDNTTITSAIFIALEDPGDRTVVAWDGRRCRYRRRAFLDIVVPVYLEFLLTSAQRFFVSHK